MKAVCLSLIVSRESESTGNSQLAVIISSKSKDNELIDYATNDPLA